MCICTPEIKSPHCIKCMPTLEETILKKKADALKILGPLGFVDREDVHVPGAIWHNESAIELNVATVKAGNIVGAILEIGRLQGICLAQRTMRKSLGME